MFGEVRSYRFILAVLVGLLLGGCGPSDTTPVVTLPPEFVHTIAAQTVVAELTEQAALVSPTYTTEPTSTETPSPTPEPTSTEEPSPTPTEIPQPTASPEPSPSPEPTPSPLPVRDLILEDDFEQTETWASVEEENFSFRYQDGGYRVANGFTNGAVSSIRNIEYRHILVEVDAQQVAGPEDAYFGVICRWQDTQNYYGLVAGGAGFYGILRLIDGEIAFLDQGVAPSGEIFRDSGSNRIAGSCLGDRLILIVNGQRLMEVRDESFESGNVGVVVGTRSSGGVEVHFDNFALLRP
jgi:hypothetical protein